MPRAYPPSFPSPLQIAALRACRGDRRAWANFRQQLGGTIPTHFPRGLRPLVPLLARSQNETLTAEERDHFSKVELGTTAHSTRLNYHARVLLGACQQAEVATLLLKGMALVHLCYPALQLRPMSDVDVLVHPHQRLQAAQVLRQLGYRAVPVGPLTAVPEAVHALHAQAWRHPDGVEVDLHWRALEASPWEDADREFWRQSRAIEPLPSRVLSRAHNLLHVCIHGYPGSAAGFWVLDALHLMEGSDMDWEAVEAEAARRQASRMLGIALDFLTEEFDAPVPKAVVRRFLDKAVSPLERLHCWVAGARRGPPRWALRPVVDYLRYRRGSLSLRCLWEFPMFMCERWGLSSWRALLGELEVRIRYACSTRFGRHSPKARPQRR